MAEHHSVTVEYLYMFSLVIKAAQLNGVVNLILD